MKGREPQPGWLWPFVKSSRNQIGSREVAQKGFCHCLSPSLWGRWPGTLISKSTEGRWVYLSNDAFVLSCLWRKCLSSDGRACLGREFPLLFPFSPPWTCHTQEAGDHSQLINSASERSWWGEQSCWDLGDLSHARHSFHLWEWQPLNSISLWYSTLLPVYFKAEFTEIFHFY